LDAQTFPPLRYAVPDLLPEGFALLVGPPKIGKSWFVINALLGRAAGGYALGTIPVTEPRRVLYLALEDSDRRMQDRCRALLGTDEPIPPLFHYLTVVEPGQLLATIDAFMTCHPQTALVVVDTLGKIMPPALPGESAYQRDYRVGSALQQLARDHPGLAVVVCHHDRKATSSDFIDSVSGTHGLAGAADSVLVLTRDRSERAGLLKVAGRDIPEGEYALVFDDGRHWRLDGPDLVASAARARDLRATAGLGDRSAEVISFVGKHPQGATPAEVAAALGIEEKTVSAYLSRAVKTGRLSRPHRGLYTPVGSVGSVGSDGDDHSEPNTSNTSNTPSGEAATADFQWSIEVEPVGPCSVCAAACCSRGPDGQPAHPGCWTRRTPPGVSDASAGPDAAVTGSANGSANGYQFPTREQWTAERRTLYSDDACNAQAAVSRSALDHATPEEITETLAALAEGRRRAHRDLRAARSDTDAGDSEDLAPLQEVHRRYGRAIKSLRDDQVPLATFEGGELPELRHLVERYQAAVDAALATARRDVEARPVDDAAWAEELEHRQRVGRDHGITSMREA
ncbi:MAG TPA: AAA family ATPase, partial [Actinomycetota bacterium]